MRDRRLRAALLSAVLMGCTAAPQPSQTSSPPVEAADEIVIGVAIPSSFPSPFFTISNTTAIGFRPPGGGATIAVQLVYNGLYRYDDSLAPVPDLAAEPCEVAADQVTIRCRLVDTTFHDGTPLTADDVAYTFELGRRHPDCLWAFGGCYGEMLESVTALDERTVEFRLSAPNATFLTLILPTVMIDSRAVIEAAYAPLAERAPTLDAAEYQAASDAIFAQLESDAPDCEAPLAEAEPLLEAAAIEPLPREQFNRADGSFDACMYAEWSAVLLGNVARSLGATGLDAIALAYQALAFNRAPVGSGPFRFVGVEDGTRAIFEAFQGFHRGPPATPRIEIRIIRDWPSAPAAIKSGELDWLTIPTLGAPEMYEELSGEADLQFAIFPDTAYFLLVYNLRDRMLFADRNLRIAVELCIDKPATVDAASDGTGDVIYSPIEPASWAYEPDLPRPERDVEEARRLIEASGWTEGADGIYKNNQRRLATDVFVRGDAAQRVKFMDLVAEQVRDCGIEFTVIPADATTVLGPLSEYPHIPGGYEEPFEAIFIGFLKGFDPADDGWHSRNVTSAAQPRHTNFMGFDNPRVDELLDEGIATYDQRERARIYRELQVVLAEERASLFAWAPRIQHALDVRLGLTEGELNLASGQWFWQLEKLLLRDGPDSG